MTILDYRGNPVNAKELERELARPTSVGVRSIWRQPQIAGLTPAKLARILRQSNTSNQNDTYLTLAEEMEEKDLHYASVLRTRKLAVSRLRPKVEAVSDEPADVELAEFAAKLTKPRIFKGMLFNLMDAVGKGYSMVEILWNLNGKYWRPKEYKYRDPKYFKYDATDLETIRLITEDNMDPGIDLPPYKFLYHTPLIKSGAPIRGGLARLAAFAFMCKSYSVKDWMAFAEVFGMPLRVGKYGPGDSEQDIAVLKTAIANLGHDAGCVIPESMVIDFIDAARMSGTNKPVFAELAAFMNGELSKGILGQTMTTEDGSSRSQAEVHNTVREDIRDNDAEQLAATIQRDLINPFIRLNKPGAPEDDDLMPVFSLEHEEPEDLKAFSDALTPLVAVGLRVESQAVRDKFGLEMPAEDAEIIGQPPKKEEPEERPVPGKKPVGPGGETPEEEEKRKLQEIELAEQRALKRVINALTSVPADEIDHLTDAELKKWRTQMDPIVKPILQLAQRSLSYSEFTEGLGSVLSEMDDEFFIERMATTTSKARGLGDSRDSPAAVASMARSEMVSIMAQTTTVQSVVFDKELWTHEKAIEWLGEHEFKATKTDETEGSYRFRQREPGEFQKGSFRTIELTDGVKAVIGKLK